MFEKSSTGAYCNRLYDLGERHGPFSCYGQIKANRAGKSLIVTNINTKAGPPNRQRGLLLNSSFNCQIITIWATPSILTIFHLPFSLTLLKIKNGSLCHCVKSYHMEDIVDILLYNSVIVLRDQIKHLEKTKYYFNFPGHVKQGEKNILHNTKPPRT